MVGKLACGAEKHAALPQCLTTRIVCDCRAVAVLLLGRAVKGWDCYAAGGAFHYVSVKFFTFMHFLARTANNGWLHQLGIMKAAACS